MQAATKQKRKLKLGDMDISMIEYLKYYGDEVFDHKKAVLRAYYSRNFYLELTLLGPLSRACDKKRWSLVMVPIQISEF